MKIFKEKIGNRGAVLTAYIQEPSREMPNVSRKPAVLVFPGGAYLFCSDREAEPIALAYSAEGFQTFILNYSVGKKASDGQPLKEASEALALIIEKSEEWHIHKDQIAVIGFSAGGHLASWVGLKGDPRPNAIILAYGASSLVDNEDDEDALKENMLIRSLLGTDTFTKNKANSLNMSQYVTKNSPPLFSWSTSEDVLVKASTVLDFAQAYAKAGVPFELHIYQKGEHGLSLAKPITAYGRLAMVDSQAATWFSLSVNWLWDLFGAPQVEDKPYEPIPGLISDIEDQK